MNFLAHATQQITMDQVGLGAGGLGLGGAIYWGIQIARARTPEKWGGVKVGFKPEDSRKLKEVHEITTAREANGRIRGYFELEEITRQHEKQNTKAEKRDDRQGAVLQEISRSLERSATIQEMILRKHE